MKQVEQAENILRGRGYTQYRVRHHGELCRIEVDPQDFEQLMREREDVVNAIRETGYRFVTLDLSGYSMGSSA